MIEVSDRFLAAVAAGHTGTSRAALLEPDGTSTPLEFVDANVTVDAKAAARRQLAMTLADDGELGLVPTSPDSFLAPYGNEIQAWRGINFIDGTTEEVSLGVFPIDVATPTDTGDSLTIDVVAYDRSRRIADAKLEAPLQIPAGTLFTGDGGAIDTTLKTADPTISVDFTDSPITTPIVLVAEEGADPWDFAMNLAMAIGMDLYFDADGVPVVRPLTSASPVVSIAEGDGGVLLGATKPWSREGVNNRIIVTGENTGSAPVRAVATDDNPDSPTYYYGPFGKVPLFESLSLVVDGDQAADVAAALLERAKGTSQPVSFDTIVNPALEPDDVIAITRERLGMSAEKHVIDSLTIPCSVEASMGGATRVVEAL